MTKGMFLNSFLELSHLFSLLLLSFRAFLWALEGFHHIFHGIINPASLQHAKAVVRETIGYKAIGNQGRNFSSLCHHQALFRKGLCQSHISCKISIGVFNLEKRVIKHQKTFKPKSEKKAHELREKSTQKVIRKHEIPGYKIKTGWIQRPYFESYLERSCCCYYCFCYCCFIIIIV